MHLYYFRNLDNIPLNILEIALHPLVACNNYIPVWLIYLQHIVRNRTSSCSHYICYARREREGK